MKNKLTLFALSGLIFLISSCATRTIYTRPSLAPANNSRTINYFLPKKVARVTVEYTYLDVYTYEALRLGTRLEPQRLLEITPVGYFIDEPIEIEFMLKPDYRFPYHLDYSALENANNMTFEVQMDRMGKYPHSGN
ncbi:MAG: hypothetical protein HC880_21500 [Bacteroidia bacterium]|nr:hypothetical protein [Bacteroidia bacterium]